MGPLAHDLSHGFGRFDLAGRTVAAAVSGGGDSLALLFLLHLLTGKSGGPARLVAITIDHGLRREAAAEAATVRRIAGSLGIDHITRRWPAPKQGAGIQAAAREARHALLAQAAAECGADIVATGHNLDDQAETVAMRRARGDGRGAAGIAPATLFGGRCWFVRPLLGVRRAALRDFLTAQGVGWIDDPSNQDRRYERVRVRAAMDDSQALGLAAEAEAAGLERSRAGRRAAQLIEGKARFAAPGLLRVDPDLLDADPDDSAYALRLLLACVGGREQLPDRDRVAGLLAVLRGGRMRASIARCVVDRRKGGIFIHRERRGLPDTVTLPGDVWDGRFRRVDGPLPAGDIGGRDVPAALARAAAAALPGGSAGWQPVLAPFDRYLTSFDLAPARALAALFGAAPVPPPPFARHIGVEA